MRKTLMAMALLTTTIGFAVLDASDAAACGGCFHPPNDNPTVVTDHRMILSVSPQQTTLYDQIRYQGSPSSFAWVLPINGVATIGLSADSVFQSLDIDSATTVIAPNPNCPPPPSCPGQNFGGTASADAGAASDSGVIVTHTEVVGPYETVQLHSTDPNALTDWLSSHGFSVPADIAPIIAAYVNEHFDFLALKLVPGAGVQSMRPVRVTTPGASPVLPLRMIAAGTGATVGVTLWMVSDGRYEPQNFPTFRIDDSELVWDWTQNESNYRELRAQKTAAGNGRAWEIESSLVLDSQNIRTQIADAVQPYPYQDAGVEYPPTQGDDGGAGETSDQLLNDDMNTLFAGLGSSSFRLTRLRADLAHAALATDLVLQATSDQSVLSNMRRPSATNGQAQCPSFSPCGDYPGNDSGTGNEPPGYDDPGSSPNHAESFSCATAPALGVDSVFTFGGIAGLLGFSFVRSRRRRR